ncbi:MAG: TPD domain-containing protein [Archaeoglobaceae archaeon]|nr:TPD domain-containing protein [Archaeoglobales archaeon]MDI9642625.1 TPD domain-containing protein [Archaeoglobales archaeon]
MRLSLDEYMLIRKNLNRISDFGKFQIPRGILHAILMQKKVESVKRKYHLFSGRTKEILEFWEEKKRLPEWLTLTPVLKVRLLLKGMQFTTKEINKSLRDPTKLDGELSKLVYEAVSRDFIYSPIAAKLQGVLGKIGERIIEEKLKSLGIKFKTEKELRMQKTPDFYFEEPLDLFGNKLKWIESKALFADLRTYNLYFRKQISKYKELFGDGLVVYWRGSLAGLPVSDGCEFDGKLKRKLLEMTLTASMDEEADGEPLKLAEKFVGEYIDNDLFPYNAEVVRILGNMGFKILIREE